MARAPYSAPGLLPFPNPVSDWVAPRRNALLGFGSGLLSSNMGDIGTSTMRGMELDRQIGQEQQDFMQAQEEENATKEYLRSKGYNDLLAGVEGGGLDIGTAWTEALKRGQPTAPDYTAEQQNFLFAQDNPEFASFIGGGSTAKPPQVESRWNPQTGLEEKVQWDPAQGWVPFGGAKAAPGTGDLSATETRELFQTEDAILAGQNAVGALDTALDLNTKTRSGMGSDLMSTVGANLPDWVPVVGGNEAVDTNTLQLKNIITEQALSQLKTIFGAAPTEGERQILLQLQGSVDQPAPVRQRIFERAKELATARLRFNEERRQRILSGGYGTVQQGGGAPATGGYTVLGVE